MASPAPDDMSDRLREARKDIILIVLWCLGLGVIVCWVSLTLRMGTREDVLHNLTAMLQGAPLKYGDAVRGDLPFYSRILFPLVHHAFSQTFPSLSDEQWYVCLRIVSYQGGFLAFALVCHFCIQAPRSAIGLATALLAMATIAGFNHPWEEPSDALDLVAISLGVGAVLRQRYIPCFALSILFAANRDSAAFLGVAWFVLLATKQTGLRRAVEGFAIFACSYGTAFAIRWMVSGHMMKSLNTQAVNVRSLLEALSSFNPLSWLVLLIASFVLFLPFLAFARPRAVRLVALAMLLVPPTVSFGVINEIRVFLPIFVLLAFAVAESHQAGAPELCG
jgi:hypothetical protein